MANSGCPDSNRPSLAIKLLVSVCVKVALQALILSALEKLFVSSRAIRKDGWKLRGSAPNEQQQQELDNDQATEMKFLQIENHFTLCRNSRDDVDEFESLVVHISAIFKSDRFKDMCGQDKLVLVCWGLYDTREHPHLHMARWILPPPSHPICLPVQSLELVLYNTVSIKTKQQDTSHDPCGIAATLACIEDLLWEQKAAFGTLVDALDTLADSEGGDSRQPGPLILIEIRIQINKAIDALETIDRSLTRIVCFIDNRVGRHPALQGRVKLLEKLRAFLRGPLLALDIDDPALEANKVEARRSLGILCRTVPVLAIHIRLHDPEVRAELKRVCDGAGSAAAKREMTDRLAIVPGQLENSRKRAAQMKRVRHAYEQCHGQIVDEVELLLKSIGQGKVSFRAGRKFGLLGRRRVAPEPCRKGEEMDGCECDSEFEVVHCYEKQ